MNLAELRNKERVEFLDDLNEPYGWSDAELNGHFDEAQNEAAERALLIRDRVTAAVCRLPLQAGVSDYSLHESIIYLDELWLETAAKPIEEVSLAELVTRLGPYWRRQQGIPGLLVRHFQQCVIVPQPQAVDTVLLTVYRRPLADEALRADEDVPVIPGPYHADLLYWVAYRAFSKPDPDRNDPKRAAENLARFEAVFGVRKTAVFQQIAQQMPRDHVPTGRRFA